jgi:hypothetical protein
MPINPANLYFNQITPNEFKEYWVGDRSPSTASFNYKSSNVQAVFWVPMLAGFPDVKLKALIERAMGVDYVEQTESGYKLRRLLPMFHPERTSLYCDGIVSINGVGFRGDYDTEWSVSNQSPTPLKWSHHEVVLSFGIPKYKMLGDSQVTKESQRYCQRKMTPSVSLVGVEKGIILLDAPDSPRNNKPALQAMVRRESAGFQLIWYRVPAEWVHAPDELPYKLLAMQGRVNKEVFFGREAETIQCIKVDLGDPYVMPLITEVQGELSGIHDPYFAYDIVMDFEWYDPTPKGKAGETRHGWNFYISTDLKYYYGTAENGQKVYNMCDFDKAFTHYSDTAGFLV